MTNIFPLPDLLAAVASFWCDLLTALGILSRQRDRVRTVGLTRDVGGERGPCTSPSPDPESPGCAPGTCLERQEEI